MDVRCPLTRAVAALYCGAAFCSPHGSMRPQSGRGLSAWSTCNFLSNIPCQMAVLCTPARPAHAFCAMVRLVTIQMCAAGLSLVVNAITPSNGLKDPVLKASAIAYSDAYPGLAICRSTLSSGWELPSTPAVCLRCCWLPHSSARSVIVASRSALGAEAAHSVSSPLSSGRSLTHVAVRRASRVPVATLKITMSVFAIWAALLASASGNACASSVYAVAKWRANKGSKRPSSVGELRRSSSSRACSFAMKPANFCGGSVART